MMKTIYVDDDFKCHISNDGTMTAVQTDFFDDKCSTYIEGYRVIPAGESWTREDGEVFCGEMIAPWKDYSILEACQEQYEVNISEQREMIEALKVLGVEV